MEEQRQRRRALSLFRMNSVHAEARRHIRAPNLPQLVFLDGD